MLVCVCAPCSCSCTCMHVCFCACVSVHLCMCMYVCAVRLRQVRGSCVPVTVPSGSAPLALPVALALNPPPCLLTGPWPHPDSPEQGVGRPLHTHTLHSHTHCHTPPELSPSDKWLLSPPVATQTHTNTHTSIRPWVYIPVWIELLWAVLVFVRVHIYVCVWASAPACLPAALTGPGLVSFYRDTLVTLFVFFFFPYFLSAWKVEKGVVFSSVACCIFLSL